MKYDLQIHLSAPECSGRAIRLRKLTPSEKDACSVRVAKELGAEVNAVDYAMRETRELVEASLVAVTADRDLTEAEVNSPETRWLPLDQKALGFDTAADTHYDRLFEAKDDGILCGIVNRWLRAMPAEIDAIMGKATRASKA